MEEKPTKKELDNKYGKLYIILFIVSIISTVLTGLYLAAPILAFISIVVYILILIVITILPIVITLGGVLTSEGYRSYFGTMWQGVNSLALILDFIRSISYIYPYINAISGLICLSFLVVSIFKRKETKGGYIGHIITSSILLFLLIVFFVIFAFNQFKILGA